MGGNSERLSIALKSLLSRNQMLHALLKSFLSSMTERRMTKIVSQGRRLNNVRVNTSKVGECRLWSPLFDVLDKPAANLSNLQRVSEPVVANAPLIGGDDLRDASQSAES